MKGIQLALGIILVLLFPAFLHAQDRFEAFGGYSYFRASVSETGTQLCPGPPCASRTFSDHPSLNGWEGSLVYKPTKDFGVVADFGGTYGSLPARSGGGSMHTNTYLFGPQVSFPARVSPFVHVLAGVAHESTGGGLGTSAGSSFFFPAHSGNSFPIALGAGIDVKVVPSVSVRLLQLDYLASHFVSSFQNQQRVSAGVVFHF
jgi:opacity protein-like surface antigen